MAQATPSSTWRNGFRQPTEGQPWVWGSTTEDEDVDGDPNSYVTPPSKEIVTSDVHNDLGINVVRIWPTLYDGTNNPHGLPSWWKPLEKVDVLIVGAGPSGLAIAASLARQGVSFRIIDKSDGPLLAGRADGVQPRFLETISMWGLASEVHEEGPLIERTAIYKNGKKLLFDRSHQSDSRYRGLHIITQGQIERIYVRDLARHGALVERSSMLSDYTVSDDIDQHYPVCATLHNERTSEIQTVRAKYLIGSDGASSSIRKSLSIPFDGVSTDIYWGIMDCLFATDYPHAWVFGSVISSEYGGCVIIPREGGYIRLYTQLDLSMTGSLAACRQARDPSFVESGGKIDIHSITPEEVLEQANRIFAPYKLSFGAPLSWFAIWKISERVARYYSSPDNRVHLVGDAAHVHSVMGAFGLNASILDAANLAWKVGLAAKGMGKSEVLLPTYNKERRQHAVRVIEVSGTYLRFVCGSDVHVPNLRDPDRIGSEEPVTSHTNGDAPSLVNSSGQKTSLGETDLEFLADFFKANGQFLLGVDCPYGTSAIVMEASKPSTGPVAIQVLPGVRAPNPRVCFGTDQTGYLYDKFAGPSRFHLVIFASSLAGKKILQSLRAFAEYLQSPGGFYGTFGGAQLFNLVLVAKIMPFQLQQLPPDATDVVDLLHKSGVHIVYDDRAPDEDAHTTWGANHSKGGIAVVRPDLWVGTTSFIDEIEILESYFDGFLQGKKE